MERTNVFVNQIVIDIISTYCYISSIIDNTRSSR